MLLTHKLLKLSTGGVVSDTVYEMKASSSVVAPGLDTTNLKRWLACSQLIVRDTVSPLPIVPIATKHPVVQAESASPSVKASTRSLFFGVSGNRSRFIVALTSFVPVLKKDPPSRARV